VASLDLSTFSLGPIAFGDTTVVPPPGLGAFTADVDLRPASNIIARITASLDTATGLLTWRLVALDPATGELPEDPLVGLLPPNTNPPAGQGTVLFTVDPRPGLATGTVICNRARIVFDLNAPIDTAETCNKLDNTKPASQVDFVGDPGTEGLEVRWSGTDAGAGILDYTIFVSEDGGPFTPFLVNTAATSAHFLGTCGKSYRFYSVARDATGNVEDAPGAPDAETTLTACDLALTGITAPRTVRLAEAPVTKRVRVGIQNRSPHKVTIPDMAALGNVVSLTVE